MQLDPFYWHLVMISLLLLLFVLQLLFSWFVIALAVNVCKTTADLEAL